MRSYIQYPMVAGPVSVPEEILSVMARDYGSGQLESDYLELYADTASRLAQVLGTRQSVILMTGEGMLALWGALKSCLSPGDRVLSIVTGVFGDGIGDMAASIGCEVEKVRYGFDETVQDLDRIREAAKRFGPKMVTVVHCETPSGTLNPVMEIGKIKEELGIPLLYVDAVASAGGAAVLADCWHADLVLGGSQKCLSAPPSMSFLSVSETAWEIAEKVGYAGYDAISPFRDVVGDGRCPYTPYWQGTAALHQAAGLLLSEGLENVFSRHEAAARRCREGLAGIGVALFVKPGHGNSPTVTAAKIPSGWEWPDWHRALHEKGLAVSGSFGPMAGKVFRLGHMGSQATDSNVDGALSVIREVMGS